MKVRELMAILSSADPDTEVFFKDEDFRLCPIDGAGAEKPRNRGACVVLSEYPTPLETSESDKQKMRDMVADADRCTNDDELEQVIANYHRQYS